MIGSFGPVVFEVSADKVRTPDNLKRKRSARFVEHEVLDKKPVLQFVGEGLDEVSFSIRLDAGKGVNPTKELIHLGEIKAAGTEQTLILGGVPYGKFVLETLDESWRSTDGRGRIIVAIVNLKLKEYDD